MKDFLKACVLIALLMLFVFVIICIVNSIPQDQPQGYFEPPFEMVTVVPGTYRFIDTDLGVVCYQRNWSLSCLSLGD